MTTYRVPRSDLDATLVAIVRSGQRIDKLDLDTVGDQWVIITEDRIETRSAS